MKEPDILSGQTKPNNFQLCLSLNTLVHLDYESQLRIAAQAGWNAVGISMTKVEEFLATGKAIEDAKNLLENQNIYLAEMMGFRDWISKRGEAQSEMFDLFRNFSRKCKQLGNPMLLIPTLSQVDVDNSLATENFKKICQIAAGDGNRVGLEFIPYSPIDTLKKAWRIVKATDSPNGGIVLDFFHYFKGKSLLADLEEVPIEKIFHIHVSDLKNDNPEKDLSVLSRNHRLLPGEGDYVFGDILENLFERGYSRYYSLEVLNKDYPHEDPLNLANRAKESLERLLNNYAEERLRRAG